MRLWSIHPKYLDSKGLVALWRESLLAQNVLAGKTNGYKNHPQLQRFKSISNPMGAIGRYLRLVAYEAVHRGYKFNIDKINPEQYKNKINVTIGQLEYEFQHLLRKLELRDYERYLNVKSIKEIEVHPLFEIVDGDVESWEVVQFSN